MKSTKTKLFPLALALSLALTGVTFARYSPPLTAKAAAVPTDVYANYTFDGDFKDSSANKLDATGAGTPQFIDGKFDKAFHGSGHEGESGTPAGNYNIAKLPDQVQFEDNEDITISMWLNNHGTSEYTAFFSNQKYYDAGSNMGLSIVWDYGLRMIYSDDTTGVQIYSEQMSDIPNDEWCHAAFTIQRGKAIHVYLNGTLRESMDISGRSAVSIKNGNNFYVGADGLGRIYDTVNEQNYDLDDLRIYKRALSADEVNALATSDIPKEEKANVKVGIIGDPQMLAAKDCSGAANLKKALTQLKEKGIEVLLFTGDMAEHAEAAAYDKFNQIFTEVFSDAATAPKKILVMGNHDYYGVLNGQPAKSQQQFMTKLGLSSINTHEVVNGHDFIGISTENDAMNGTFSQTTKEWVSAQLQAAVTRDATKPIFVAVHQPVQNTTYGSDDWGNSSLYDVFKDYPQVVVFAGHTHYALNDERSIHQKEFTSINTASLKYLEMESGKVNGSIPPNSDQATQGLYLETFADRIEISRLDIQNNKELKEKWVLDNPIDKAKFKYTDARIAASVAPTFPANGTVAVSNVKTGEVTLTFTQGAHPDLVHSYKIDLIDKNKGETKTLKAFSDFYFGKYLQQETLTVTIPVKDSTNYDVKIYAIESFGKESVGCLTTSFRSFGSTSADEVMAMIQAFPTITLDSKAQIQEAREAYNALSESDRAKVTNYSMLQEAEAKILALEAQNNTSTPESNPTTPNDDTVQTGEEFPMVMLASLLLAGVALTSMVVLKKKKINN